MDFGQSELLVRFTKCRSRCRIDVSRPIRSYVSVIDVQNVTRLQCVMLCIVCVMRVSLYYVGLRHALRLATFYRLWTRHWKSNEEGIIGLIVVPTFLCLFNYFIPFPAFYQSVRLVTDFSHVSTFHRYLCAMVLLYRFYCILWANKWLIDWCRQSSNCFRKSAPQRTVISTKMPNVVRS